jgi:aquaporin Z
MTLSRKLTVEFIGAFFLVFTVGTAVATHISGGHYNPAVSTAVFARGKMVLGEYVPYVVTQLVAGVLAGLLVRAVGYAPHGAAAVAGTGKMLLVEFLFTFALCYVVLNVATASDTENNSFYGLAIGFTVMVGAFAVGKISGGAFNPAVAVGASVLGLFSWSHIWIYLLAELVAGGVAAGVFLLTQPAEKPVGEVRAVEPDGQIAQQRAA